eukprot:6180454-Pleurochrysis_carterae.AAC.2
MQASSYGGGRASRRASAADAAQLHLDGRDADSERPRGRIARRRSLRATRLRLARRHAHRRPKDHLRHTLHLVRRPHRCVARTLTAGRYSR